MAEAVKPVRPLVKNPESEEAIEIGKGKKKIEFMALTEDERLSLIELLPKKFFTNKQYKSELKKARPVKKTRINGKGGNIGKWKNQTLVDELWIIVAFSQSCQKIERNP